MLGPMWPTVGRMYTPKHFDLPDLSHARLMIQEHPLATLMLIDPTHGLSATPVPMIWGAPSEASSSEGWWLEGHLARANPHVAALMSGEIGEVLVQFNGPGAYNLDFSLFRTFPISGEKRLEFRIEAGNVLSHAVYGNPQGSITSGTYGQITGINGNYPERMVRLGLRFTF